MVSVNVLKFQTLSVILFLNIFFMYLLHKILGRKANSVDFDQTALGLHFLHVPF